MNRVGWTPALLFSIWSSLCGAATPGLGTPHEGGLFIFREPVEMYWNDWVAYPRDDKAAVLDQPEATIKADGKTVSFNALLKINCKTRKTFNCTRSIRP